MTFQPWRFKAEAGVERRGCAGSRKGRTRAAIISGRMIARIVAEACGRMANEHVAKGTDGVRELASLLGFFAALANLDVQPLDLLVERGERDVEALGGFRLVPVAAFQHVADHAPLAIFQNVEQ